MKNGPGLCVYVKNGEEHLEHTAANSRKARVSEEQPSRARARRDRQGCQISLSTMADISRSLEQLVSISDQRVKIEQYKTALTGYLSAPADTASLQAFVEHVAGEAVPLSVSRVVLLELAQKLPSLPAAQRKTIGLHVIDRTAARATSFEEAVSTIREHIAGVYEEEEEWSEAARMLSAIPLDSGIRQLSNDYKVEKYIKIAMLFLQAEDRPRLSPPRLLASSPRLLASSPRLLAPPLPPAQDDESVNAEQCINKASLLLDAETTDPAPEAAAARLGSSALPSPASEPAHRRSCCSTRFATRASSTPSESSSRRRPQPLPRRFQTRPGRFAFCLSAGGHALPPAVNHADHRVWRAPRRSERATRAVSGASSRDLPLRRVSLYLGGGPHYLAADGRHLRHPRPRRAAAVAPARRADSTSPHTRP